MGSSNSNNKGLNCLGGLWNFCNHQFIQRYFMLHTGVLLNSSLLLALWLIRLAGYRPSNSLIFFKLYSVSYGRYVSVLWQIPGWFPKHLYWFTLPWTPCKGFPFLKTMSGFAVVGILDDGHSAWDKMNSLFHCIKILEYFLCFCVPSVSLRFEKPRKKC